MIPIGVVLCILILACVIGNFFVIVAILIERDLRSRPQYYLIFSLAVADLLVSSKHCPYLFNSQILFLIAF